MKKALTAALGLALAFTLSCDKESKTPAKIVGGTYSFRSDENAPSGTLMVYPLDERSALFSLSLFRGAPSYNSGELSDKMAIKDNAVIYEYESCKLKFEFSQDNVKITTDEKRNECGFGAEVVADNTYKLINKAIPEYYINMQDDTIRFNNATATATAKPETAQPTPAGTGLCVADENILISFKMEKSSKILSVCVAKDESYIVYRFGAQGNIEFEFPENKTGSWDKFAVSLMQSRLDDMYKLEFANYGYKYEVYHNYERQRGDGNYDFHSVGVVITKVSTGKQTNLEGISNSIIGSLDESQKYKKLKITTEEIKPDDD